MFKINRNFLILILLYFLGFTGFLGGPYGLAKFFFFFFLLGTLVFAIFVSSAGFLTRRMFLRRKDKKIEKERETIKVEAEIIE
jgi:hypothetical protein